MRLILSRKGFDSSAGGCPSPIFPDGSLYPLPIPDARSGIQYGQLHFRDIPIGELVQDLTRGRHTATEGVHLDPDMYRDALSRRRGWRPLLGQTGAAQGHLRRQGVDEGDLFLFFGLFRPVEMVGGHWRFVKQAPARHVLWGWMGIGQVKAVDGLPMNALPWARYHPHFNIGADPRNTLYISSDEIDLCGRAASLPGAGIFPRLEERLVLTRPDSPRPSAWRLPDSFYPQPGRSPLSYHANLWRWEQGPGDMPGFCKLQSAARGQEFVLDMDQYPGVTAWLARLLSDLGQPAR
ncbi:hypothetical protein [Microbulbifer yueqingensis]|uniref:Nucleotide modification associated domain-containing protein n=1 Tax=Microbulbifer yueqingensis TaxID=658219 RepID=A0A1G9DNE9_9GAMM|nr:hypothetical protein [Microbulbifer yueqingensis]SDK65417.1 hypothetical protein SAMN05216212_2886 [Microbulbifer yueqingensis]